MAVTALLGPSRARGAQDPVVLLLQDAGSRPSGLTLSDGVRSTMEAEFHSPNIVVSHCNSPTCGEYLLALLDRGEAVV